MNPRSAITADSNARGVGEKSNANQVASISSGSSSQGGPSPAQAASSRDRSDEPNEWLTIGQFATNSEQVSGSARNGVIAGAPVMEPADAIAAMEAEPLTLDEVIKQALVRSLRQTAGNRRRTASLLGISRSTLYRMLSRYGINRVGRA